MALPEVRSFIVEIGRRIFEIACQDVESSIRGEDLGSLADQAQCIVNGWSLGLTKLRVAIN